MESKFGLLPAANGKCPECATEHLPNEPHNLGIYYQYRFYAEHGRFPTWDDAMAHCNDEIKEITTKVLREQGIRSR